MYRGLCPCGTLFSLIYKHFYDLSTKSCQIRLQRIELNDTLHLSGSAKLKLCTSVNSKMRTVFSSLRGERVRQSKNVAEVNFSFSAHVFFTTLLILFFSISAINNYILKLPTDCLHILHKPSVFFLYIIVRKISHNHLHIRLKERIFSQANYFK